MLGLLFINYVLGVIVLLLSGADRVIGDACGQKKRTVAVICTAILAIVAVEIWVIAFIVGFISEIIKKFEA